MWQTYFVQIYLSTTDPSRSNNFPPGSTLATSRSGVLAAVARLAWRSLSRACLCGQRWLHQHQNQHKQQRLIFWPLSQHVREAANASRPRPSAPFD
eukprot:scaffold230571_cov35-Tisochrysis_lutea.AAC.1